MIKLTDEARKAAREAAKERWITGSSDTTQMLLSVDAALLAALPHLEGAKDHEPGTRFVVVEIPPEASGKEADEITEKVFSAAADIDAQYDGPWDLFIYRQHNAPPANVPAVHEGATPAIDREALIRLFELSGVGHDALLPSLYRSELADKVLELIGGAQS